jgi:hypothetical protein
VVVHSPVVAMGLSGSAEKVGLSVSKAPFAAPLTDAVSSISRWSSAAGTTEGSGFAVADDPERRRALRPTSIIEAAGSGDHTGPRLGLDHLEIARSQGLERLVVKLVARDAAISPAGLAVGGTRGGAGAEQHQARLQP